jgi:isopentenyl-diphosphate Delta-isomerase
MSDTNKIVLVDADGNDMGAMEKIEAHRTGRLHRAFSIFIFNSQGALLLQQRADTKYHSGGLWSNSCCSHPVPGEALLQGAHRRLQEELGFDCELTEIFTFTYRADVGNGLIEHEHDHVLVGIHDGAIRPDPDEIQNCKWVSLEELAADISSNGCCYTDWLKLLVEFRLPDLTREIKAVTPSPGLASAS